MLQKTLGQVPLDLFLDDGQTIHHIFVLVPIIQGNHRCIPLFIILGGTPRCALGHTNGSPCSILKETVIRIEHLMGEKEEPLSEESRGEEAEWEGGRGGVRG